jgi:hypothetical protein
MTSMNHRTSLALVMLSASIALSGCGNANYSSTMAQLEPAIAAIELHYQKHGEFPADQQALEQLDTSGKWKGAIMMYDPTSGGYSLVTPAGGYKDYLAFERSKNQGSWAYGDDSGDGERVLDTRKMPPLLP